MFMDDINPGFGGNNNTTANSLSHNLFGLPVHSGNNNTQEDKLS